VRDGHRRGTCRAAGREALPAVRQAGGLEDVDDDDREGGGGHGREEQLTGKGSVVG
jgi:hypothetical protein